MTTKIVRMPSNWRPDENTLLHPGDYRVPEDWDEQLAAKAVAAGVAFVLEDFSAPKRGEHQDKHPAQHSPAKRGRKSRGRAPENK